MKNYLTTTKEEEKSEEDDEVSEFEGDYLAQNLDKLYYVNFNNGMFTEQD